MQAHSPVDRHPVLPGPSPGGQHRLRARARRRRRGSGRPAAAGVLLLAAHGRACADRRARAADAIVVTVLAAGGLVPATAGAGGTDEELGHRRAGQPGRPDPAGPVPDLVAGPVGRQRRGADPAGRRHPGRDPRVRRPPDHRAVLVQGGRAGRPHQLRPRPRADRPGGRHRGQARPAAARPGRPSGGSRSCCRPTRPSTPASATRSAWTPRPVGHRAASSDGGRRRTTSARRRRRTPRRGRRDGDALIHAIIAAGGQDENWLTEEQLAGQPGADQRRRLPGLVRHPGRRSCEPPSPSTGAPPPGELFVDRSQDPDGEIVLAALRAGNVVVMVQPPRGFGANPVAIYHDPDLPPEPPLPGRLPLAARGLRRARRRARRQARQPGVAARARPPGMSAACGADAAIGDIPLIYPFLVNDPGEGTQAKRRAHATLIGHLVPPMARAESYGDIARLEQLMDEHAQIAALDPAKLPADPGPDLDADPGRQARPRPRPGRAPARHRVRRLPAARRRLAVPDQGRPDPRRAARARRRPSR